MTKLFPCCNETSQYFSHPNTPFLYDQKDILNKLFRLEIQIFNFIQNQKVLIQILFFISIEPKETHFSLEKF